MSRLDVAPRAGARIETLIRPERHQSHTYTSPLAQGRGLKPEQERRELSEVESRPSRRGAD